MHITPNHDEDPANAGVLQDLAFATDRFLEVLQDHFVRMPFGELPVLEQGVLTGQDMIATCVSLGLPPPEDPEAQAAQANHDALAQFVLNLQNYGSGLLELAAESLPENQDLTDILGIGDDVLPFAYSEATLAMGRSYWTSETVQESVQAQRYDISGNPELGEVSGYLVSHFMSGSSDNFGLVTVNGVPVLSDYAELVDPHQVWQRFYALDQSSSIPEQYVGIMMGDKQDPGEVSDILDDLVRPHMGTSKEAEVLMLRTLIENAVSSSTPEGTPILPGAAHDMALLLLHISGTEA